MTLPERVRGYGPRMGIRGRRGATSVLLVVAGASLGAAGSAAAATSTAAVTEIRIAVGDLTFDALTAGPEDGDAVLLLHGFPETSESFRAQVVALGAAGYRAVAPNQRGYSPDARPAGVEAYNIVNLVNDVVGMADSLGINRFHVVGHDWGGAVAWVLAALYPDRLLSLTSLATPHPAALAEALATAGSAQAEQSGYIDFFRSEGAEDLLLADDAELFRSSMISSGMSPEWFDANLQVLGTPEALGAALNWYRALDTSGASALPLITTPTMYVYATGDTAFARSTADATADYVEGPFRYEVLDGVSHWIPDEVPDVVNELLLDQLAGVGPTT